MNTVAQLEYALSWGNSLVAVDADALRLMLDIVKAATTEGLHLAECQCRFCEAVDAARKAGLFKKEDGK